MGSNFDRPTLPPVGWVAELREEDRDLLATYGEFISIQPDHDMIRQGENQEHIHLIIRGKLEVRRQGIEDDVVMGVVQAGECLGEVSLFDSGPASASIRALEFTQAWRIDRDSLASFISEAPVTGNMLLIGLATELSRRLRSLSTQLVDAKIAPHH